MSSSPALIKDSTTDTSSENMSSSSSYHPILIRLGFGYINMSSLKKRVTEKWPYLLFSVLLSLLLATCFSLAYMHFSNPENKLLELKKSMFTQNITNTRMISEYEAKISDLESKLNKSRAQVQKSEFEKNITMQDLKSNIDHIINLKNMLDQSETERDETNEKLHDHMALLEQWRNTTAAKLNATEIENEKLRKINSKLVEEIATISSELEELKLQHEEAKLYKDYYDQGTRELGAHQKKIRELQGEVTNLTKSAKEWQEKWTNVSKELWKIGNETEQASTYKTYTWDELKKAINVTQIKCSDEHIRDNTISYLNEALQRYTSTDRKSREYGEICKNIRTRLSGTYTSYIWGCIMGNFSQNFQTSGNYMIPFELDHGDHLMIFTLSTIPRNYYYRH